MQNLTNKINSYIRLSEEELNLATKFYRRKAIPKGDLIIQPGQYVKHWHFVDSGCFYFYSLKDGKEKVLEFFTESNFFTDIYAYIQDVPSNCYVKATEDSVIYSILKQDLQKSYDHSHKIERIGRLSMQDTVLETFRRIAHLNNLTNEERYLRLLEKRPALFQRVPQYMIASYLGLTPVGLSKIRRRLSRS
ncbi:MAG: CRP-like cAMP-binding protein [Saprospiraceae bacterium]